MPHAARLAVALSLLALSACQPGPIAMTDTPSDSAAQAARDTPAFRRNPAPREAYRITMRIEDAPGPFGSIRAFAQYDVVTPECLPPPNDNNGHLWPVPTDAAEIALTREADGSYTGVVYADYMLDEDYHDRGMCKWALIQAQAQLKATGVEGETSFGPALDAASIRTGIVRDIWLAKTDYPAVPNVPDYPALGTTERAQFSKLRDDQLFHVLLQAREVAP